MASLTVGDLFVGNDNLVTVDELKNVSDGSYINDATVTMTLKDSSDADVANGSWPVTLGYVTSSNGKYQGVLQDGITTTSGSNYVLHVDVTGDNKIHTDRDKWEPNNKRNDRGDRNRTSRNQIPAG